MKIKNFIISTIAILTVSTGANAASMSTVNLSSFLQNINITNDAGSTANINQVVYSFGAAGDGIATWDSAGSGVASDFLSNASYFQTVTWATNIAAGASQGFSGLDIDLIEVLNPLGVTGSTLNEQNTDPGISLSLAYVSLFWDDGTSGTTSLLNQIWSMDQTLTVSNMPSAVPVPAAAWLFGTALIGLFGFGKRRKAV